MADKKISALTASSTPLAGTEVLPIVQSSTTVKVSVANLTAGRAVSASSLTASTDNVIIGTTAKGITTGSAIPLGLGVNNTVTAMTIDTNSNVGVGTTAPDIFGRFYTRSVGINSAGTSALQINGTTYGAIDLGFNGARTANLLAETGGFYIQTVNASNMYLLTNGLERMRVGSTGDVTIATGNFIVGTAGKGIDFSANTHAAGMTSELLNDYEEGTWTPTDGSGAGLTFTGTSGNCFYTKVGNLVTCVFGLVYPTTADLSGAKLAGLPFTSKATSNSVSGGFITYTNSALTITPLVGTNDTGVNLFLNTGSAAGNNQLSTFILRGIITYMV
jgi:hypothetical protein